MSFEKKIPSDDTLKNGLKDIADAIYDAEAMVSKEEFSETVSTLSRSIDTKANKDDVILKANVNTGTFDPTSDNPVGQKSIDKVIGREICRNGVNLAYIRGTLKGNRIIDFSNVFRSAPAVVADLLYEQFRAENTWHWGTENYSVNFRLMFAYAYITHFDYIDELQSHMTGGGAFGAEFMFWACYYLQEVGAYDFTNCNNMEGIFVYNNNLKHIHLKNIPVSFGISASTRFEESDLVEILNNLMDLTGKTSQTLTMGVTNLAKLTDAEKAIAVNKNWVLA